MDSSKLSVKFFFRDAEAVEQEAFVPVFHRWIQQHALQGHQLIDVADYAHVPEGPGIVLVSHEANLSTDDTGHQRGLLYFRKTPIEGDFEARLGEVFRSTLLACKLLEDDEALAGKVAFKTDAPRFRIHDRLLAPNTAETFADVKPTLESFLSKLYGGNVTLAHEPNDETLFEVKVTAGSSPSVGELLKRLA
jgi:hypothetical protein